MIDNLRFRRPDLLPRSDVLVVDDPAPVGRSLNVDHHVGNRTPAAYAALTTAGMVRRLVADGARSGDFRAVTIRHFDTDGALGIWTLGEPTRAREHGDVIDAASRYGDFYEADLESASGRHGVKVSITLQEHLVQHLGVKRPRSNVATLFTEACRLLPILLQDASAFEQCWRPAFEQLETDTAYVRGIVGEGSLDPVAVVDNPFGRPLALGALATATAASIAVEASPQGYRITLRPRHAWGYAEGFVGSVACRDLMPLRRRLALEEGRRRGAARWRGIAFDEGLWVLTTTGPSAVPVETVAAHAQQLLDSRCPGDEGET